VGCGSTHRQNKKSKTNDPTNKHTQNEENNKASKQKQLQNM